MTKISKSRPKLGCVFCPRPASLEVYIEQQWRPCCRVCYHQRRVKIARTRQELLDEAGMLAFRWRAPIRNRLRKCHTSGGQQLALFE
jgi:hypothetical protein